MDYIIPKKKLFNAIYSYIDSELIKDNLDWTYADDNDFTEGYDDNLIEFRGESWDEYGECMLYIKKEYYEDEGLWDRNMKLTWGDKAPILELKIHHPLWKQLQDTFDDLWKPVIEKWFKDHYPEYPVKTFIFPKFQT